MALRIEAEPVPLESEGDGAVRVRGSRVTLDTIIAAFHRGTTAEEIAQQYPSLELADIYAVIAYYLRRTTDVDAYLQGRQEIAKRVRRRNEDRSEPAGVRDRLLSRRTGQVIPPDASPLG